MRHAGWIMVAAGLAGVTPGSARAEEDFASLQAEAGLVELGIFGGAYLPPKDHPFVAAGSTHKALRSVAPDFGLRLAYFPWDFLGLEVDGQLIPENTDAGSALMYGVRGHVIAQLPTRLAFFLAAGGGYLGVSSDANVLGSDGAPFAQWGLGVKYAINRWLMARFDGRHLIGESTDLPRQPESDITSHFEVLLGLSVVLGRTAHDIDKDGVADHEDNCPRQSGEPPDGCPPRDIDRDGVPDNRDKCPEEPGDRADGCLTPVPPDRDWDGLADSEDKCPDKAARTVDGCPDPDPDRDGVPKERDLCPDEPGKEPDGCPVKDADQDGMPDATDKCPGAPETRNGFQDDDGCPDELPKAVEKFTGTIGGIRFASGSAKIEPSSFPVLNEAFEVLDKYKELRIEVSGHTDDRGKLEKNLSLSKARAESVKEYLVKKGIAPERITTEGFGPNQPVADNKTPAGREKNRRIEFRILQ